MSTVEITMMIVGALVGLLAYFLKVVHSDVRRNTEEVGRNKGRIEQLNMQITQEKEMRQMELKNLDESMQKSFAILNEKISDLIITIKEMKQ